MFKLISRVLIVLAFGWAGSAVAWPITGADVVQVDGKYWAQVDLFTKLSWNDMNVVCPSGVCIDGGMLNGYDMTGWTWAATNDVNAVLNYYIGTNQLGPGPDAYQEFPGSFAASFFADGWRVTQNDIVVQDSRGTIGLMSDNSANFGYMAEWTGVTSVAVTSYDGSASDINGFGGWFYRDTPPQIPTPATLTLFGLGLTGLGRMRRRKT